MNVTEALAKWQADKPRFEALGVYLPDVVSYLPDEFRANYQMALDAQPGLATSPNSAVPSMLTTFIDPAVIEILFAANKAAEIFGEVRKGTWLDETAMFPLVEHTGEVSSYGDHATSGVAGANTNWPQRQAYLFQTIKQYGERELERAGLARINWVSEIDKASGLALSKYQNFSYFFGVVGLQNYGLTNDPNLSASATPGVKANGNGNVWVTAAGFINASANEVYSDIETLFFKVVQQTAGAVDRESKMTLALSPGSSVALTATNTFNVNVGDLLKKNFPNLRVETAVQYGVTSASNPQGITGGNLAQLIADEVEGQDTGYCAFNEKMRAHPIVRDLSSFKQKVTSGTWGAIIRQPMAISSMIGI
jgi:hypothetical protein